LVVHVGVMGQEPYRLFRIGRAGPPGAQLRDERRQDAFSAGKMRAASPADGLEVGVDLDDAFGGYPRTARPEGGKSTEAAGRQSRKERTVDAVPGWDDHRQEAVAEQLAKPLSALHELAEDHGLWPVRAQLGRLFAPTWRGVIDVGETVLNHRTGRSGEGLT